ncbi:hypothetical protein PANDA_019540, partial [Ailuropoda melanoleuca]
SSAETLRTVSRRSVPASSMPYLALAHSRVSSLYHAASVDGSSTSQWNVADSFSCTSRSCSRFLKGTAGSAGRERVSQAGAAGLRRTKGERGWGGASRAATRRGDRAPSTLAHLARRPARSCRFGPPGWTPCRCRGPGRTAYRRG